MTTTPEKRVAKARTKMAMRSPFLASVLFSIEVQVDEASFAHALCNTAFTDGTRVVFHPVFLDGLSDDQVLGTMAHEVLHVALKHTIRMKGKYRIPWNIACDVVVNKILENDNFKLPEDRIMPSDYDFDEQNETVEDVYNRIMKSVEKAIEVWEAKAGKGDVTEIRETPKDEEGNVKAIAQKAEEVARTSKNAGSIEGYIARHILQGDLVKVPKLYEYLPEVLARGRDDYSWARPAKRMSHLGVYLPSLNKGQKIGNIVFAIDTSGSISDDDLTRYVGALRGLLDEYDAYTLWVVMCDTRVAWDCEITENDPMPAFSVQGGGGTAFTPVFEWVDRKRLEPDVLIYGTDLWCTDYPSEQPEYEVIWLTLTGDQGWGKYEGSPDWGVVCEFN